MTRRGEPPILRHPVLAWVDGRLVDARRPALAVTDRGFQLGDGLFETLRVRRGVPIEWEEHHGRLVDGASLLQLRLPAEGELLAGVRALLDAEHLSGVGDETFAPGDASVRITVSRGALDARGTLPPGWATASATVVIQAWTFTPPPDALLARGIRAITSQVVREPGSPLAGVKTTSRADSVFARLEAERAGANDAIYPAPDGSLAEGTSANLFALSGDRLVTPPIETGILVGTTRTWLLVDGGRAAGLAPEERRLQAADLLAADEAFLCSSVAGIVPLVSLDGRPIGDGRPGHRTGQLRAARERWIDERSLEGLTSAAGVTPAAGGPG
ncbi:MAG TPA: aminotransferase class IV [Candidatus Limnocylindrales bacterium]|nr:aminotransferase class IV [Candidatus Limnocylindrales bacterium]